MQDYIENRIKPLLQGDGGWIDFVSFENGVLKVMFQGECSKCLILGRCVSWIEEQIEKDLHEKVTIEYERKRPFFWDK
jgi:Fe-S cluster biogenesis protein NfuA